jgi:pteridine reductase
MFDCQGWESMLRTNVVAPVALCHYAQEHLKAGGCGRVINLCDISASRPWPDRLAYCTSKAALAAVTKGLARALAPEILVNGIAPGIAVFSDEYTAEQRRKLTGRVPLGRAGTPEEVARLVRFLVESGDYITGQVIPLDGGRSII